MECGLGPYKLVPQRHCDTVFRFGYHHLLGKTIGRFFCFLWVAAIIAVPRVVFAWHYPSDIVGSLVLGPACVFLFNAIPYPRMAFERTLMLFEGRMYIVHALLVIFLMDASNLFLSLQEIEKKLARALG
jgi:PAP2 superfamily protein